MNRTPLSFRAFIWPMAASVSIFPLCDPAWALSITVSITDPDGQPIPNCGFLVRYENKDKAADPLATSVTNPGGSAVVELPATGTDERVEVRVTIATTPPGAPGEDTVNAYHRFFALAEQYRWPRVVRVPVTSDQESVSVAVPCTRAIAADARVVRSDGSPIVAGNVILSHAPTPIDVGTNSLGSIRVRSIPAGEPFGLFISGGDHASTHYREFPAAQEPLDLGDITVPELVKNATVHMTLDDANWEHETGDLYTFAGVTLIRSDGSYFLTFLANAQGQIVTNFQGTDTDLPVPGGTYYLLPGGFLHRPIDLRAFDLVRSGQTALVPNWPTITVAPGETATATVHAAELDAAIRATMPPE